MVEGYTARGPLVHLILDGILFHIPSLDHVLKILKELPRLIEMTTIQGPELHYRPDAIVAWVIIAESHISLHIYKDRLFVDVSSCKAFDTAMTIFYLCQQLPLESFHYQIMLRPLNEMKTEEASYAT